jgi:hypothetical protein
MEEIVFGFAVVEFQRSANDLDADRADSVEYQREVVAGDTITRVRLRVRRVRVVAVLPGRLGLRFARPGGRLHDASFTAVSGK